MTKLLIAWACWALVQGEPIVGSTGKLEVGPVTPVSIGAFVTRVECERVRGELVAAGLHVTDCARVVLR